MHLPSIIKDDAFRSAASAFIASVVAAFISFYLSFGPLLMVSTLVTFFVSIGSPVRQSIVFFVVIMFTMMSVFFLLSFKQFFLMQSIVFLLWMLSTHRMSVMGAHTQLPLLVLIFISSFLAMMSAVIPITLLQNQMQAILIGFIIGMIAKAFILPTRIIADFNESLVSVLTQLDNNIVNLQRYFLNESSFNSDDTLNHFPTWVYDIGFNRRLRGGFRFYLVAISHIEEIINSFHSLLHSNFDKDFFKDLMPLFVKSMRKNSEILQLLINYFAKKEKHVIDDRITQDIDLLEKELQRYFPVSYELIEMSPQFILATSLVREARDLRHLLLQLVIALPEEQQFPLSS